ncbi:hypothetical protein [Amycolatopsis sp. lyj-23]|uniref:hypothetical protein n=1 Tax=Amycolatopsis sp. lyj-23 TaxID=2789283 RepID=UPI00397D3B9B
MQSDHEMTDQPSDDPDRQRPRGQAPELPPIAPRTRYPVFSYPTFDDETVRRRMTLIGVEWNEGYAQRIERYEEDRQWSQLKAALILGSYVLVAFFGIYAMLREFVLSHPRDNVWLVVAGYSLLPCLAVAFGIYWVSSLFAGADSRFYNHMAAIFKAADTGGVVDAMNQVGIAARRLFALVQGSRQTWTSPPAVADRALKLTRPLLDIALDDALPAQQRATLKSLLYDVTAMVVIGRPDFIPRVRSGYPSLPRRSVDVAGDDRDILYLDPMRNRSRWEVTREYVVPLASLIVSIAAFVVASTK